MPHTVKTVTEFLSEPGPGLFKIFMPGHQRFIVISTKVVHVFHHKQLVYRVTDLTHRRQFAVRKDVFINPGVWVGLAQIFTNGVQQEQATRIQATMRNPINAR